MYGLIPLSDDAIVPYFNAQFPAQKLLIPYSKAIGKSNWTWPRV
jgi:hypothetical protein